MKRFKQLFSFFIVYIFFYSIGFFIYFLLTKPVQNKIINIYNSELKIINGQRDLIKNPALKNSMLTLDDNSFQSSAREQTACKLILDKENSLQSNALNFIYGFPALHQNKSFTINFSNLKAEHNLKKILNIIPYAGVKVPCQLITSPNIRNVLITLKLSVSSACNFSWRDSIIRKYACQKKINLDQQDMKIINFPFNDFTWQSAHDSNGNIQPDQYCSNQQGLNKRKKRGLLCHFELKINFVENNELHHMPVTGQFFLKNPILYYHWHSLLKNIANHLAGLIFSIFSLIIFLLIRFFILLKQRMIQTNTILEFINKKEQEIKELELSISRKVGIEKEIIQGLKGYYHWEFKENESSQFIGINKDDFFSNRFLNSVFFEDYKKKINSRTIILIIDFEPVTKTAQNYLFYYNLAGERIKFPSINITRKSYWFYLLAFLIQTPNGYLKMSQLVYDNVVFNNSADHEKLIPCLRIPQNNHDLGIDNEKYLEMVKRYAVEDIIQVTRKQKKQEIIYSLNREINYTLFIHSKFIEHSAFQIKDHNIINLDYENFVPNNHKLKN